jgi:hypothetical protein
LRVTQTGQASKYSDGLIHLELGSTSASSVQA